MIALVNGRKPSLQLRAWIHEILRVAQEMRREWDACTGS